VVEASTRIRWSNSSEGRGGQAQISTDSATVVGVEPPGPFALLPLTTLEQAGGFVISGTVRRSPSDLQKKPHGTSLIWVASGQFQLS
jgi:hypothetical protein